MTLDTPAATYVWLVLWRAARAVETHARRHIASLGLCLSDFGALEALLHKGPMPVNTLGRKVLLTSGAMTAAVDRLERRGLVTRRPVPRDRRARLVHLTAAGHALIQPAFREHAARLEEVMAALSDAERATAAALLKKLGTRAEALLAPAPPGGPRPSA